MLSFRERIFRSSMAHQDHHITAQSRPSQYRNWSEDSMRRAYIAVMEKQMSIRQAAETFSVPKSTLCDRVSGKTKFGSHSGPEGYLSDEEEDQLVRFILGASSMGYARTKKEVLAIVDTVLATKGIFVTVSNGWFESFKVRHPCLSLRSAEKLSYARFVATDPVILNNYFDLLQHTLDEYNLFDSPSQIWNCDETGLPFDHKPPSVIVEKGQKHARTITTGNKKQITVLCCSSAAGSCIPPLIILRRKALNSGLVEGDVPGSMYGLSNRGWIDSELFENWFKHHFLAHVPSTRQLLLLLDGHSSHYHPTNPRVW